MATPTEHPERRARDAQRARVYRAETVVPSSPLVPVNDASDVQRSPQFQFREYFQPLGGVLYPTVPYKLSATPAVLKSAAPKLGEHKSEILAGLAAEAGA